MTKKKPPLSQNQIHLRMLKDELDSLKKKLQDKESNEELYFDSLQHDFDLDRRSLINDLSKEKKQRKVLEAENKQLTCMLRRNMRDESMAKMGEPKKKRARR